MAFLCVLNKLHSVLFIEILCTLRRTHNDSMMDLRWCNKLIISENDLRLTQVFD